MMRKILFTAIAVFLPTLAFAKDEPKPNTLSPKEIDEGWILLFDGETTFGWKTEGEVKVEDGQLKLGGTKASSLATTTALDSFDLQFDYFSTGKTGYAFGGFEHLFPSEAEDVSCWMETKIEVESGRTYKANFLNPATMCRLPEGHSAFIPQRLVVKGGAAPIRLMVEAGSKLALRSIKLKPKNTKLLFNAKDLTGWKVFDEAKKNQSKWSVTKEGWLNVKNGPGDLQSEGKYDDFVLQLECISNGKALNSGIFFRCIDGQYQNGYEMQIQNGFKDNDRTKPADFGTGAIYRRIAARKVVPNDNKWFAMTLVANGNHISTWVNGYQTVDWTDDRPADPNPRKGSKTGAGHLSIQGHDPTTDLSFRNLRIAELKSEKK